MRLTAERDDGGGRDEWSGEEKKISECNKN